MLMGKRVLAGLQSDYFNREFQGTRVRLPSSCHRGPRVVGDAPEVPDPAVSSHVSPSLPFRPEYLSM